VPPQPHASEVEDPVVEGPPPRILASPVARKMARELGVDLQSVAGSGPAGRIMTGDIERAVAAPAETPAGEAQKASRPQDIPALPLARKLAREAGVDLGRVAASGPAGRVTPDDVRRHLAQAIPARPAGMPLLPNAAAASSPADDSPGEVSIHVPLRGLRRSTARRMDAAWRVPHVSVFDHADATRLVAVREALKPLADRRNLHLTYLPLIVKLVVQALREHPRFNATLDLERDEVLQHHYYHIGIATAIPEGLMVPVIRHVEHLTILEIAAEIERLSEAARQRTLALDELRGATFTVTNFGSFGGWLATPIINPPEVAILGLGRIEKQAVVVDDRVEVRPRLPLVLSFDHRVIDGHDSGRFMTRLGELLSRPETLLLELR
jgi:pyruvate dehydrogenase E2 component (dihydrolipoamide acetyltransferase)